MFEISIEHSFAAGHYLRNYDGKCARPHGHNYRVFATLQGNELDKAGLLLDFQDLKKIIRQLIDKLDHQMLNDVEPFTQINPSAENLAKCFYAETNRELRSLTGNRVAVKEITIWETANAAARYSE